MKKIISTLLAITLFLGCVSVIAEGMGVQVIGGPVEEAEPVNLDDLKLNVEAEIPKWGILKLTGYEVADGLGYYRSGRRDVYNSTDYYWSGNEAEYVIVYADILNTALADKNYMEHVAVKVVFDDVYEYGGWSYQRNYNNSNSNGASLDADKKKQNSRWAINASDIFNIGPMYEGHYIYGCTLPNAVINSKKPLKMIITIDGNEITYNIRK